MHSATTKIESDMCCCTAVQQFPVVRLYVLSTHFFYEGRLKFDCTSMYVTGVRNGLVICRPRQIFLRWLIHRDWVWLGVLKAWGIS